MGIEFILVQIFIIFLAAKIAGELFVRVRQPPVLGELLVGIIIGNFFFYMLLLDKSMEIFNVLAELGIVFLLFTIGLETKITELRKVGWTATLVAIFGVLVPFGLCATYILYLQRSIAEAMFIGAVTVATSVGITARVLRDINVIATVEAKIILGAAVIDDVLGMIVLGIVSMVGGIKTTHGIFDIFIAGTLAVIFVLVVMFLGDWIVRLVAGATELHPKIPIGKEDMLRRLRMRNAPFAIALILCFGLSALATYFGLAAIIGSFLAGMAFAEIKERYGLVERMDSINDFLVPFFFVVMGMGVVVGDVWGITVIVTVITLLAIAGKLFGCGLPAYKLGRRSMAIIGIGMVPRGEVGLIIAMAGYKLGVIDESMFSVAVLMCMATTLISPPILKYLYKKKPEN
ncbi:MAG: cation:proton antiporter [Candidatus Thermoplasmatota archaeon]